MRTKALLGDIASQRKEAGITGGVVSTAGLGTTAGTIIDMNAQIVQDRAQLSLTTVNKRTTILDSDPRHEYVQDESTKQC